MVTELLQKYIWLVQTFIRAGENGLTLQDISYKWENRFNTPYPRRTFNNHRRDIESIFNIVIECNRSTNRYFIEYSDDVADENAESAWLINTFSVNNLLRSGKDRLSGRVSVENIPSGHIHLATIMDAMNDNLKLQIEEESSDSVPKGYVIRTDNSSVIYLAAFAVVLLIAEAAIMIQAFRLMHTNPAEALKKE